MMKTGVNVGDAMTRKPVYVTPETSLSECAKIMHENNVGSLIVSENEELQGILSERDMVKKALIKDLKELKKLKAKDIMTRNVITITSKEDIYDAILTMKDESIRRLPVVAGKKIVGLLTYSDILKIQPDLYTLFIERFQIKESERKSRELKR